MLRLDRGEREHVPRALQLSGGRGRREGVSCVGGVRCCLALLQLLLLFSVVVVVVMAGGVTPRGQQPDSLPEGLPAMRRSG